MTNETRVLSAELAACERMCPAADGFVIRHSDFVLPSSLVIPSLVISLCIPPRPASTMMILLMPLRANPIRPRPANSAAEIADGRQHQLQGSMPQLRGDGPDPGPQPRRQEDRLPEV